MTTKAPENVVKIHILFGNAEQNQNDFYGEIKNRSFRVNFLTFSSKYISFCQGT
jgi:hypothetical protein